MMILFILIQKILLLCNGMSKGCLACGKVNKQEKCIAGDLKQGYYQSDTKKSGFDNIEILKYNSDALFCKTGYYLLSSTSTSCSSSSGFDVPYNCLYSWNRYNIYNSISYNAIKCQRCKEGYYFFLPPNNNQPIDCKELTSNKKTNCKYYSQDINTEDPNCAVCQDNYHIDSTYQCISVNKIDNCKYYQKVQCDKCKDGFKLNKNYYQRYLFEDQSYSSDDDPVTPPVVVPPGTPVRLLLVDVPVVPDPTDSTSEFELTFLEKENYYYKINNFNYTEQQVIVDQCEPINTVSIPFCLKMRTGSHCEICEGNRIPDTNQTNCIDPFQKYIQFCETYFAQQTACTSCQSGYFLETPQKCSAVDSVPFCKEYTGNFCKLCENQYKLININTTNQKCLGRSVGIENCKVFELTEDLCNECNTNFFLIEDKTACTTYIFNCLIYERQSSKIVCKICNDLSTYDGDQCVVGSIGNCLKYAQNNECIQCKANFYLSGQSCVAQSQVSDCKTQAIKKDNYCDECNSGKFKMTHKNQCLTLEIDNNCETYQYYNKCLKCKVNYKLNADKKCIQILKSNCQQIDELTGGCIKCADGYNIVGLDCSQINDYLMNFCKITNKNGLKSSEYTCNTCNENTIPVDITLTYQCTIQQNLGIYLVENCIKYKYINQKAIFECSLCKEGFVLTKKLCKEKCNTGEVYALQKIQKKQITVTTNIINPLYFESVMISQHNTCEQWDFPNCKTVSPEIFFQSPDYRINDYVCIECNTDFLKVVAIKQTSNYYTPKYENPSIYFSDLSVYPGLKCQDKSTVTLVGESSNGLIPNCDFYFVVSRGFQADGTKFGCLKCKFQYNGLIENHTNNIGYIHKCVYFDSAISSTNDSVCLISKIYTGFTRLMQEVDWNTVPLETYLSCHFCVQASNEDVFSIFLFLHFEDISKFPIHTHYNAMKNEMKNHPVYLKYKLYKETNDGYSQRCLKSDLSLYFPFDKTEIYALFFPNMQKRCAVYIMNTLKYNYLLQTYNPSINLVKETVYCATCFPGFRAVLFSQFTGQSTDTVYYPYRISGCETIENCSNAGSWVNNCQICQTGYVYKWDVQYKQIRYDYCIANVKFQCLSAIEGGECKVCKKGYGFRRGICELVKTSFCEDTNTIFQDYIEVDAMQVQLGRSLIFRQQISSGCNKCQTGYVSKQINSILPRNLRITCAQSNSLTNSLIETNIFKIKNCKYYNYITEGTVNSNGEPYIKSTCVVCEDNYILTTTHICIQQANLTDCIKASYNQIDGDYDCIECKSTRNILNYKCVNKSITNCKIYDINPTYSVELCSQCNDSFYLATNKQSCISGSIVNCKIYSNQITCEKCKDGYQEWGIKDSPSKCLALSDNCYHLSHTDFENSIWKCDTCRENYFVSEDFTLDRNLCIPHPIQLLCLVHSLNDKISESSFLCLNCESGNYFSQVLKQCTARTNEDVNCIKYDFGSDTCVQCKAGFSLKQNNIGCEETVFGIDGCEEYKTFGQCHKCTKDFYYFNNTCQAIGSNVIAQCKHYEKNSSGQILCIQCGNNYYLSTKDNVITCLIGLFDSCIVYRDSKNCHQCATNYILKFKTVSETQTVNGSDVTTTYQTIQCDINNNDPTCEERDPKNPTACLVCVDNYYNDRGVCVLVTSLIDSCSKYQDASNCLLCLENFKLKIVGGKWVCIVSSSYDNIFYNKANLNCRQVREYDTDIKCSLCDNGYYFDRNNDFDKCINYHYPANCAIRNDKEYLKCTMCNTHYQHEDNECQYYNQL